MPPTVAFNALALRPGGSGVQTYSRQLLAGVAATVPARLVAAVQADALGELPENVRALPRRRSDGWRRALEGLRSLGPATIVHGLDVDLPLRPRATTVATFHDLSVVDEPWSDSRARILGERIILARTARLADELIAVSGFTAERIKARYGRSATVIPLAASPQMRRATEDEIARLRRDRGLPASFVLYIGDLRPRKRVDVLAAACRRVTVPLVLAGDRSAGPVPDGARHIGYVEPAVLPVLYSAAAVFAYPSAYEGFGLPVVEALACGTAVVCTPVPCVAELLPGAAAVVPRDDEDALAGTIRELMADESRREELARKGRQAVGRLSWRSTTEQTVQVYRRLGL